MSQPNLSFGVDSKVTESRAFKFVAKFLKQTVHFHLWKVVAYITYDVIQAVADEEDVGCHNGVSCKALIQDN